MPLAPSAHLDVEPPLSGGSALVQPSPGVWLKLNRGEGSKKANGMAEKGHSSRANGCESHVPPWSRPRERGKHGPLPVRTFESVFHEDQQTGQLRRSVTEFCAGPVNGRIRTFYANSPLRRCCTEVVHVVDDFCFLRIPLRSNVGLGDVEILQVRRYQDWVTQSVALVFQPPPFPKQCSAPRVHRRLLVPHHDLLALAPTFLTQHKTSFHVPTSPPRCAWEETGTPLRALPSTQSFRSNSFR